MYDRFTGPAREVLRLAEAQARDFRHEYVGTEHILLGLIKSQQGVALAVLDRLRIDPQEIAGKTEASMHKGPHDVEIDSLPQTPRAGKVQDYAVEEARRFKHNYVGTEHLLLGLMRDQECVSGVILANFGLTLDRVRAEVRSVLGMSNG